MDVKIHLARIVYWGGEFDGTDRKKWRLIVGVEATFCITSAENIKKHGRLDFWSQYGYVRLQFYNVLYICGVHYEEDSYWM